MFEGFKSSLVHESLVDKKDFLPVGREQKLPEGYCRVAYIPQGEFRGHYLPCYRPNEIETFARQHGCTEEVQYYAAEQDILIRAKQHVH